MDSGLLGQFTQFFELLPNTFRDTAKPLGMSAIYLLTTTAERFFPRFGFEVVTREDVPDSVKASVEFQGACPATAVIMRRTIRG